MTARRRRRLLLALGIVLVAGASLVWIGTRAPSWYHPTPHLPETIALGEQVEYRLVQETQRIRPLRPPETWSLRIREHQLNAWLCTRLQPWYRNRRGSAWPETLAHPQLRIRPDAVELATRVGIQPLLIRVHPKVDDHGLRLTARRLRLGHLPVPGSPFAILHRLVPDLPSLAATDIPGILEPDRAITPELTLADGRRVRLLRVTLGNGYADLTCRTLAPTPETGPAATHDDASLEK